MPSAAPILVVDDDEDILRSVADMLAFAGYVVMTAEDGARALDILAHHRVSAILLDMKMPGMDGWAFARAYDSHHGQRAPIVVLTAARDAARWASEVNATAYLAKPFDMDELLDVVERVASAGA